MKNVEDLFPLSPMQKMMLLHTVAAPSSDVLLNQFCYEIKGEVDVPAFHRAWQWLVDQHPVLRAVFLWEDLKQPLQAIRKNVEVPFESDDLDNLPDAERRAHLDALIARDRRLPFDPVQAPLMRVRLVRLAKDSHYLIWSSHHLLLDRFCLPIVFDDLGRAYEEIRERGSANAPPRRSFRHYIGWIQRQDQEAARAYWRGVLSGFRAPTTFRSTSSQDGSTPRSGRELANVRLEDATSATARALAKKHRVTLSSLFQGAIAIALARHCRTRDVVFGATVSGRPAELDGVESILGSFVNNVPIRIRLTPDDPIEAWLLSIQRNQQERQAFEYVARSDIETSSDLAAGDSLFDTLFVWLTPVPPPTVNGFRLHGIEGHVRTGYPVTISVTDETPRLKLEVNATHGGADAILDAVVVGLESLLEHGGGVVGDVLTLSDGRPRDETPSFEAAEIEASPVPAPGEFDDAVARTEYLTLRDLLLKECRTLLRTNAFDASDSFFDAGGNSIHAVRLHAKLEAMTGRSIPLLELFKHPTVEQMATATIENQWPAQDEVARAIRGAGTAPPLFCVTAPGVATIGYVSLAERLSPERPVYVLQTPAGDDDPASFTMEHVDELSARYSAAMKQVAPEGPYNLLSMCGGAHVAVEMARRLADDGERVGFVGIVNTWSLYTVSPWKVPFWRLRTRFQYYRRRLRKLSSKDQPTAAPDVEAAAMPQAPADPVDEPAPFEWWKNTPSRAPGTPDRFDGTVSVFRIRPQQAFRVKDDSLGWRDYARSIDLHHLRSKTHLDIMRGRGLDELATKLDGCLSGADEMQKTGHRPI